MEYFWNNPFLPNARWSTAYKNSLSDGAFLYVDRSRVTHVDSRGRSHPLDARHLPVRDRNGRVDCAHVRNAIARAPVTTSIPPAERRRAQQRARALLGRSCPLPEREELPRAANPGEYFVWESDSRGRLKEIGGPLPLQNAKTFARIGATEGKHNRIVTRGRRGRLVIRKYEAGTGARLV